MIVIVGNIDSRDEQFGDTEKTTLLRRFAERQVGSVDPDTIIDLMAQADSEIEKVLSRTDGEAPYARLRVLLPEISTALLGWEQRLEPMWRQRGGPNELCQQVGQLMDKIFHNAQDLERGISKLRSCENIGALSIDQTSHGHLVYSLMQSRALFKDLKMLPVLWQEYRAISTPTILSLEQDHAASSAST